MRKKLWGGSLGVAIAVACFALLWLGGMDRRLLLDRSTLITSVQGWGLQKPDIGISAWTYGLLTGGAQYQWIGNRQILFFHDLTPIQFTVSQSNGAPSTNLDWPASVGTPTLYDVATHSERPLPKLTELFRHEEGEAKTTKISPDGARMLWRDGQDHVHCAMLDGSWHLEVDSSGQGYSFWAVDSKQFHTYGWGEDEHKQNAIEVYAWDITKGTLLEANEFAQPAGYDWLDDCILTSRGNIATYLNLRPYTKIILYEITPPPHSIAHTVTPTLPAGSTVQALFYSPRGDKLAWIINRTVPDKFAPLHRWIPQYKPTPQKTTALWVSGTLGENLHEIGHIPITEHGRQFYLLDYVRWQPDGKMLSFVSNDTLYTVPAD